MNQGTSTTGLCRMMSVYDDGVKRYGDVTHARLCSGRVPSSCAENMGELTRSIKSAQRNYLGFSSPRRSRACPQNRMVDGHHGNLLLRMLAEVILNQFGRVAVGSPLPTLPCEAFSQDYRMARYRVTSL